MPRRRWPPSTSRSRTSGTAHPSPTSPTWRASRGSWWRAGGSYPSALTAPDGRFEADPDELAALATSLRPWEEVGVGRAGPARATFRLTETEEIETGSGGEEAPAGTGWRLEFLLQSMADPSLLVPAEQAWNADGSLRRWLDRPAELLLAELGRASRIYPELASGLRTARPSSLRLDAEGAYHFLSTAAVLLDEAGFGVLLPSWWDRRRKLGLALSAHTPVDGVVTKAGKFGRHQLVEFRWELAVGEDALTEDEIAALAETKAPLIRLRGQWVAVDPEQLRRGLEFLARTPTGRMSAAEILTLAANHPDDLDTPLELTSVRADGWLGELLSGAAAGSLQPLQPPPGFTATLRPYQQRGLSWLTFLSSLGLGSCLADDMGLGKTVQLLAVECLQRHQDPGTGPTLLLCPMSLVGNWQREAAKFAPGLRIYAHHGGARRHGDALREHLGDTDLVVTTYATATRDIDELAGYRWKPGRTGRGAGGEEQPVPRRQGGATPRGDPPRRAHRDPGGEPSRRAVVDHGFPQSRPARLVGAVPHPLRDPGRTVRADRAGATAARDHPALRAAPAQDRPGDHRRPAREDREHRGDRAAGQRARRDGQAPNRSATIRHTCCTTARPSAPGPAR